MGKNNKKKKRAENQNQSDVYLLIGFLSLILLHILGGFWHSFFSWGFSHWASIPNTITLIIGSMSILSVLSLYFFRNKLSLNFIDQLQFSNKSKPVTVLFSVLISLILGFVLYTFRSQAFVYGDGYSMLDFCSTNQPLEIIDQHKLQLLALYWHQFTFKTFSSFTSFNKEEIFALTNVLGGIIGLWGIYKISVVLSRSRKERLFFIIISLSSASIILFFGYIENYTWATSFMLWSLYYSIRYTQRTCRIFPLLFFSFLAFAFHMITLPALVTVLFVILYRKDSFKKFIDNLKRFHLVIIVLVGSLSILLFAQLKGLSTFVPIWAIPKNNYSLFALSHLSDIFNLLLLIAPLGLLFFFFSLKKNNALKNDSTEKVLFVISLLTFLSACFIDPHLGMMRDFDLFSFYGIPLTLWSGYRFSRVITYKQFPSWIIIASLVILLVHVVPNLYEKNHPNIAVEHLDKILWEDPHYQNEYQDAFRGLSWGYILRNNSEQYDLSEKYFTRSANSNNLDPLPLYNLGVYYIEKNQLDSARHYFHKGKNLSILDPKFLSKLAEIEFLENNISLAEKYSRESLALDSNHIHALSTLGIILRTQNKHDEALKYFSKVNDLKPNDYMFLLRLGVQFSEIKIADSAIFYMDKSLPYLPPSVKHNILGSYVSISISLNRKEDAIRYFNQLKAIAPNSLILKKLEKEIYGQ